MAAADDGDLYYYVDLQVRDRPTRRRVACRPRRESLNFLSSTLKESLLPKIMAPLES